MLVLSFIAVGLLGMVAGFKLTYYLHRRDLGEREAHYRRLYGLDQQESSPYRDGDVVHYLDAAHASVRVDRCQDKIKEQEELIAVLRSEVEMWKFCKAEGYAGYKRPEPTSLPSSGSAGVGGIATIRGGNGSATVWK